MGVRLGRGLLGPESNRRAARDAARVTSLTGEMAESALPNGVRVLTERIPGVRSGG